MNKHKKHKKEISREERTGQASWLTYRQVSGAQAPSWTGGQSCPNPGQTQAWARMGLVVASHSTVKHNTLAWPHIISS